MESSMTGRKYMPRSTRPHRRYRRNARQSRLGRLLAFQTIICVMLLLIVVTAKSLDISAAVFITEKARYVLEHDVELKKIYYHAGFLASDIRNSILKDESSGDGDLRTAASDSSGETATLSAEMTVPDTIDASSGILETFENKALSEGISNDDALLHPGAGTGVLSAGSGNNGGSGGEVTAGFEKQDDTGMIAPVEGMIVTPFGEVAGAAGIWKTHIGIDFAVDKMSEVRAVLDGIVEDTGSSPGYGRYVKIRHSDSLVTVYANCSTLKADEGEYVRKGDVIADAGTERVECGSHIHFEVWYDHAPVDPLDYININIR
ncbi:MAG: M23 family metallopeptidase [Clostridiaceae bacterium]|mgnify:CR=1 FL=1|jgi:hypothetical protein|nr:M23 family metallopeptidase [Bacillota bacterium]NLP07172.1 M23 family metallopeptidase [Clostridiaceae bacterium]HOA54444.1 M23 family metallopeptidase [Clostridiales bacterium]HPZ05535.1 M23 family metallopeptidase [Clostridiales bacterium]HQD30423.1 M23 family metallopeptidase [Clostridiales bacterium]